MSQKMPWAKFFWSDWESDQPLKLCSLAAQGLWMRMLCFCAQGDPIGFLAIDGQPLDVDDIARLAGVTKTEVEPLIDELDRKGVFSRDRKGRIYSRRIVRDKKQSEEGRKNANKRWSEDTENKGKKPKPNGGPNGNPYAKKPEARSQNNPQTPFEGADSDPPTKAGKASIEADFEVWWQEAPRKVAKAQARKAYERARKAADQETLVDAIRAYAEHCRATDAETRYVKHPATWLNGECWEDEDIQQYRSTGAGPPAEAAAGSQPSGLWRRRVEEWRSDGTWEPHWGPEPDQPGTRVPRDIAAKAA